MASPSGTTCFTVQRHRTGRFNVLSPWGRIAHTFTTEEDGPLAEGFARRVAALESSAIEAVAEHLGTSIEELVMAFNVAYEVVESAWDGACVTETLTAGQSR